MSIVYQAVFEGYEGDQPYLGVTLSRVGDKGWSTHMAAGEEPTFSDGHRFWGHYFDKESEAIQDLSERLKDLEYRGYKRVAL